MHSYTELYTDKQSSAQLYRAMHSYTGLYTQYAAKQSYTHLYRAIQGYAQLYRAIHCLTEIYTAIQKCVKMDGRNFEFPLLFY